MDDQELVQRYQDHCAAMYDEVEEHGLHAVFPAATLTVNISSQPGPVFAQQLDAVLRRKIATMEAVARQVMPPNVEWEATIDVVTGRPLIYVTRIDRGDAMEWQP